MLTVKSSRTRELAGELCQPASKNPLQRRDLCSSTRTGLVEQATDPAGAVKPKGVFARGPCGTTRSSRTEASSGSGQHVSTRGRAFGNHPDEVPRGLPPGGQALGLIEERTVLEAWALAERGLLEPLPDQFGPFEQRLELG